MTKQKQNLLGLRRHACLSLSEVVAKVGGNISNLSQLENGLIKEPHPRTIRRLAKAYEVAKDTVWEALEETHKQKQADDAKQQET